MELADDAAENVVVSLVCPEGAVRPMPLAPVLDDGVVSAATFLGDVSAGRRVPGIDDLGPVAGYALDGAVRSVDRADQPVDAPVVAVTPFVIVVVGEGRQAVVGPLHRGGDAPSGDELVLPRDDEVAGRCIDHDLVGAAPVRGRAYQAGVAENAGRTTPKSRAEPRENRGH